VSPRLFQEAPYLLTSVSPCLFKEDQW
jgi:hypothetical protein